MCYPGCRMTDVFDRLYSALAKRKNEADAFGPYTGGNGRIDRAVELIKTDRLLPKSGVLLDVGGATGNLGYALREMFSDRYTLDIADACRFPAQYKGNTFLLGNVDLDGLPFPDVSSDGPIIDLIVALDFIEHILDPEKFARECFRVLRPGGAVLINTPNIQYWRHLASLVVDGVFPHTSGDPEVYHGGHVAFYNSRDMVKIFEGAGMVDSRIHFEGLTVDPPPPIWRSLTILPVMELSVADLVYSCRKPV